MLKQRASSLTRPSSTAASGSTSPEASLDERVEQAYREALQDAWKLEGQANGAPTGMHQHAS